MGRHTTWTEEIEALAEDYIEHYVNYGHPLPSVVGMANALKVNKSTLYKWAEDGHGNFSNTLAHC